MKSFIVLCMFVAAAFALPAKKTESYDDYDAFSLFPFNRQQKKEVPVVVDYEVGGEDKDDDSSFFFPAYFRPLFINPFSFMNFGFSDFFSRPSWFDRLSPKDNPDTTVKNATSSTKVVDGHKITVNDTTYENEKNGAVYRVQVIEVSPIDSKEKPDVEKEIETEDKLTPLSGTEETDEKASEEPETKTETTEEVKPDQNSLDNEIHKEETLASYELQGDDPSVLDKNVEMMNFGNGQPEKREDFVDLSSDIRVNRLKAENAQRGGLFMIPPEVEVFAIPDYDYFAGNYQQQIIEPQINQVIVQPHFHQQHVQPQFHQQRI